MVLKALRNIEEYGCVFRIEGLSDLRKAHGLKPLRIIEKEKMARLIGGDEASR